MREEPPSPASKLLADAAPSAHGAPQESLPPTAPPKAQAATPTDSGGDPQDGMIVLRLSPEGTQTGPERRKAGTTRGPNCTLPLRRLNLRRDSDNEQVMRP